MVFSRQFRDRLLTFRYEADTFIDEQTRSTWDFADYSVAGPLKGEQLSLILGRRAFWFSVSIALPDVELYTP